MTLFTDTNNDELSADAEEMGADAGPSLDDSILDEIADDDSAEADEGFGHLPETDTDDEEEDEKEEEDDDDDLLEEEEDAEDVDYDTFDDIDEM